MNRLACGKTAASVRGKAQWTYDSLVQSLSTQLEFRLTIFATFLFGRGKKDCGVIVIRFSDVKPFFYG
jgi:hypothetical protein